MGDMKKMDLFTDDSDAAEENDNYYVGGKEDLNNKANKSYDENFKKFFSRKEVLAGILINVVKEFEGMDFEEVKERVIPSEINPIKAELLNAEDTGESQKILYDVLTVIDLGSNGKRDVHLIFDLEMQRHLNVGYPIMNRAIYYTSRLLTQQNLEKAEYDKLNPVQSTWICLYDIPASLRNRALHFEFAAFEDGLVQEAVKLPGQDLVRIDMLLLSDEYYYNSDDSTVVKFLQAIFHDKLTNKALNPYIEVDAEIEEEVRNIMLAEEQYKAEMEGYGKVKREEGREETIIQCINNLLKQHQTKDYVIQTLVSLLSLDRDEALEYYEKALESYDTE